MKPKRKYVRRGVRFRGVDGLPRGLRRRIEFLPSGVARAEKQVAWLYRYLETGDGAEAAREVGYAKASAANIAWNFRREFAPLILECVKYQGVADLPLARAVLVRAMRAYDPDATVEEVRRNQDGTEVRVMKPNYAKAGASVGLMAVKAAEALMDRFGLPRAVELKLDEGGGATEDDYRLLIDRMVAGAGLDAVRQMPWVKSHREYREYVVEKYGEVKDITLAVADTMEAI